MIDIRLPNITGKTDSEQLAQIRSYLFQFASQLQWALSTVEGVGGGTPVVLQKNSAAVADGRGPVNNFNQLKDLIIKSADIVEAYYEKIDEMLKLDGYFLAASDFGTFVEETNNTLAATDKRIEQDLVSKQTIFDEKGNIKTELLVNGHIYSGIIEYAKSGEAIVGIEIGQTPEENGTKVFNRFARFTADRLAFYDAAYQNEPVAYISNYMLVITNAWVKGNLKVGPGFEFDTSNGLALRWVEEV